VATRFPTSPSSSSFATTTVLDQVADEPAEELGLDERARSDTYYAALIQPVGCTAFTYENTRLFGTNELTGIPAFARADAARPSEGMRAVREDGVLSPAAG
jgi:hypothetical protein